MGMFRKGTIWFRVPIDWFYSTRIFCIDCNQNKLQKKNTENVHRTIFDLPNFFEILIISFVVTNVKVVIQPYPPRRRGRIVIRDEMMRGYCMYSLFCKEILYITFPLQYGQGLNDQKNFPNAYFIHIVTN